MSGDLVQDVEAIRQLSARYSQAFDEGDPESWCECFTPLGRFERSNGTRSYVGRPQLAELVRSSPFRGRHVTSEYVIEVVGDAATQRCYMQFLDPSQGFHVQMFGVYQDRLVRVAGRWYFESRYLQVIDPDP